MATVAVWGAWHLGVVVAAGFARLGHRVMLTDLEPSTVTSLRSGRPPVREPGLEVLLKEEIEKGSLRVLEPSASDLGTADFTVVAVDIDVDDEDRVRLDELENVQRAIADVVSDQTILVIMSQVPVGTSSRLAAQIGEKTFGRPLPVVYIPENLRLGNALATFFRPDRLVLGADEDNAANSTLALFRGLDCPVTRMSVRSAEMSKHALNAYLATCISFVAEISDLCERLGADARDVAQALRSDHRVSPEAPLTPGLGFAGGTLGRDVQSLRQLAQAVSLHSDLADAVLRVNRRRLHMMIDRIGRLAGDLSLLTVALLGLTYKPGTDTLRRSQSVELARLLLHEGASVRAHDPMVVPEAAGDLGFAVFPDPYEAASGADLAVLMTEWPDYRSLDPNRLAARMRQPILIDPTGFLDPQALAAAGIRREVIGKS